MIYGHIRFSHNVFSEEPKVHSENKKMKNGCLKSLIWWNDCYVSTNYNQVNVIDVSEIV